MTRNRFRFWAMNSSLLVAVIGLAGCLQTADTSTGTDNAGTDTAGTQAVKNRPPVTNAGKDQVVTSGDFVVLNGVETKDDDGDRLMYVWQQTQGDDSVQLSGQFSSIASFEAPEVSEDSVLTFRLVAIDGSYAVADEVDITVTPKQ